MKTFVWLLVFFIVCPSRSLRNSDEPLVVDYSEFYFYKHLEEKMTESLSINNCTIQSDEFLLGGSSFPELHVEILSPTTEIRNRWGTKESQLQIDNKVFAQVSDNLCSSKRFKQFKNGGFKLAKGCKEMFKMIDGVRVKQINRYGATLHPGHIRCNVPIAVEICSQRQRQPLLLNSEAKRFHEYPFLVNTTNAIVSRSTMIVLPCGPFGLFSSCEAVKWGVPMASSLVANVENCRQYYLGDGKHDAGEVPVCPFKRERKIFMMSQYDDTQIGQFILESLPRLIYHLDFILENKDVKIHFGFTKQPTVPAYTLPHLYFNWLGLSDRLLNGTYYADQVWMAREGGCQDVSYGAWELLNQREVFLRLSSINDKKYSNRPLGRSFTSKAAFRDIVHRFSEEKILSKCNGTNR